MIVQTESLSCFCCYVMAAGSIVSRRGLANGSGMETVGLLTWHIKKYKMLGRSLLFVSTAQVVIIGTTCSWHSGALHGASAAAARWSDAVHFYLTLVQFLYYCWVNCAPWLALFFLRVQWFIYSWREGLTPKTQLCFHLEKLFFFTSRKAALTDFEIRSKFMSY